MRNLLQYHPGITCRAFSGGYATPCIGIYFRPMHASMAQVLWMRLSILWATIFINVHVSDSSRQPERVSVGKGITHWPPLIAALRTLPNVRQLHFGTQPFAAR